MDFEMEPLGPEDVAAFKASILMAKGCPVGTCLKLRRMNGRDHVLHLRPYEGGKLVGAMKQYMEKGNHQGLMLQFYNEPSLAETLSRKHPYNTLLSMAPDLTEADTAEVKKATDVQESVLTAKGSFVTYRVTFADKTSAEFRLHECIAFNIWGYFVQMTNDAETLLGDPKGMA